MLDLNGLSRYTRWDVSVAGQFAWHQGGAAR